jgi:xanthine/CO dehydrogenase XdhC/CoxF family maturation factor
VEELERAYKAALDAIQRGEPAAVATVIEAQGSTPRKAGAKMLVYILAEIIAVQRGRE